MNKFDMIQAMGYPPYAIYKTEQQIADDYAAFRAKRDRRNAALLMVFVLAVTGVSLAASVGVA